MGLSLRSTKWGCWRDSDHSGKNPFNLVAELLGSRQRAQELLGTVGGAISTPWEELAALLEGAPVDVGAEQQDVPDSFELLSEYKQHPALEYLFERGYKNPRKASDKFGLWVSEDSTWKNRIMFPIRSHAGTLLGWTGRAYTRSSIKYKVFPTGPAASGLVYVPRRPKRIENTLIVEGPFDGTAAASVLPNTLVCVVQGIATHSDTVVTLAAEASRGDRTFILFDRGAEAQALRLAESLPFLSPMVVSATEYDDLGDHFRDDRKGLRTFLNGLLNSGSSAGIT